jgi:uncharacterized membrane protein YphA (DoxX/SURF4 family)
LPVIFSIFFVIAALLVGVFLEKKLEVPRWYNNLIQQTAPVILSLASIGFGLSFLIFSYNGFVFAPNLQVESVNSILLIVQALAGLMILLGLYERLGGFLLIVLYVLAVSRFGFVEMMDTLEMVGFAFYAMIIGRPKWKIAESQFMRTLTHPFHQYGVSILRIGIGLNLIILGFSEKILKPSLTHNFLSTYDWNFMHNLGFTWFTDYWFAYAGGVVEALFGLFFLFGLVTRISVVALAVFLVTTLILLGPVELMGHLPHFSIALVLLVFGAGSRMHMKKK